MRILYVGRNAQIGGGTTFRLNIGRGLTARGHRVWVACRPGEVQERYRSAGVRHVWVPPHPLSAPFLAAAIRRERIDLVHASNTTAGDAAAWACRRTGVPLILSIHGLLHRNDRQHRCLREARRILTFEEAAVRQLERHRGFVDPARVTLLRRPIEHRPGAPDEAGPFRVVYTGRLSQRKGQHALALLQAFERWVEAGVDARLDVLGDGSLLPQVRREEASVNRRLGAERVSVHGAVPDPLPIAGCCHVLIGASYAALEALMAGRAVIGAGFWGFGPVTVCRLAEAMAVNFGDSGGDWPMTGESFHDALVAARADWAAGGERRAARWGLDRLLAPVHAIPVVAERIEEIYAGVLRGTEKAGVSPPAARGRGSHTIPGGDARSVPG